jgi:aminopeptidase N
MQVADITRAETSERARLLSVDSYAVTLDLTGGAETFGSTSVITFGCAEPGATSYVDLVAEMVREITLNGTPIDPARAWADGRIALRGLAPENELKVVADCRYSHDGTGLHRARDPVDGKVYTYTKFEPAYARTVFANFEQPDLKASFRINVLVPDHWNVISNEPLDERTPAGEGVSHWRFAPTPRLSTYLFAVAAGEYEVVRTTHTTPSGQEIPLGLAGRVSMAGFLGAQEIFDVTRRGLDYYTELFKTDYPFTKYDQVFVPEYSAGATENAGCVIFTDQLLFRSRVTETLQELRASVILHELAHMWFGDLVTMKWWDDLWLNESFAEFCAVLASAEATRYSSAWTTFAAGRKAWGYAQDQLPSTHPVAADVATLSEAIANFDGISYAKGASVLRQLVARIGRDSFFDGIRAYFATHAWASATLADWLTSLEASSGVSLADWSSAWLQTAGPSTLRGEFEDGPDGAFESFVVRQEAPAGHPTLRPHRIAIGLYNQVDGALVRTHQVRTDITGAGTKIPELVGVARPDLIVLNDDDLSYAVIRFDNRSMATLRSSIGNVSDSLARAVCWTSVVDMARQAELPVPEFISMVASSMAAEHTVTGLQSLLDKARDLLRTIADPAWAATGYGRLAGPGLELLLAAEPGSDHQLAWAQLLSWAATSEEQLDLIAGLLDGNARLPGLAVGADLRWALLQRLVVAGRAGDEQIDAELKRDGTDAGHRSAVACRAAIGDTEHKEAAWELLAESAEISVDLLRAVSLGFHQPEQADLLAPYAARYFDALPEIWSGSGGHLRVARGAALFPVTAASAELIDQIDAFLAAGDREPGLARVLIERRDQVVRAIRSRALPAESARAVS